MYQPPQDADKLLPRAVSDKCRRIVAYTSTGLYLPERHHQQRLICMNEESNLNKRQSWVVECKRKDRGKHNRHVILRVACLSVVSCRFRFYGIATVMSCMSWFEFQSIVWWWCVVLSLSLVWTWTENNNGKLLLQKLFRSLFALVVRVFWVVWSTRSGKLWM